MFDILFGWRKASKCKKLIRVVQCRLKLLKNKRYSIVRQLREDAAQLLKIGHEQSAFNRVEQLYKDESIMAVYELLDNFCEFIILHLSYIRRNKDCPNDINEAVSSLIFASARCGDLPELRAIRKLFGERYGQEFAMKAVELFPGNLVNHQVKEKLSIKSVPDDAKHRLVDEIFRDYCRQPGPLALEYNPEWQQQQVKENGRDDQVPDRDLLTHYNRAKEGSQMHDSNVKDMEGKAINVDSSLNSKKFMIIENLAHGDYDILSTSASSLVLQTSPKLAESPMHKKTEKTENHAQLNSPYKFTVSGLGTITNWGSRRIYTATVGQEEERMAERSSSESSSQLVEFPEETVVCLDNIEEFQSSMSKDTNWQDQRLFVFKSSVLPKVGDDHNEGYVEQYDSRIEKASLRSSRNSGKAPGKRLRKRSVSRENRSMKDIGCVIYYGEPCWITSPNRNRRSHHHRKKLKKIQIEEAQQSNFAVKTLKGMGLGSNIGSSKCRNDRTGSFYSCSFSFNCEMATDCSLEHPCYFCASDDREELEIPPWKQKRMMATLVGLPKHDVDQEKLQKSFCHCGYFRNREPTNQEKELASTPQKPKRNHGNEAVIGEVLTLPNHQPINKVSKKTEREDEGKHYLGSFASSNGSCSVRKETESPYLRALTMPPERRKDSGSDNFVRSNSCPFQQPNQLNHIHPKLPDYDELAAKFIALKQAYQQNKLPLKQPTLV